LAIGVQSIAANQPYAGCGLLGFALMNVWWLFDVSGSLTVLEDGLRYVRLFGIERRLLWKDIDSVRENSLMQRLELRDRKNGIMIPISYYYEEYGALYELVRASRPGLFEAGDQRVFERSVFVRVLWLGLGVFWFGMAIIIPSEGERWARAILFACAVGCPLMLLREVKSVVLELDALMLEYPLWKKRLPRQEIDAIRRDEQHSVVIQRADGTQEKLGGFRKGDLRFVSALESWFYDHQ
jgi:hypothetical protein